ncbi:hypothetical protein EDD96_5653 [Streptomyces sp. Ag109_G2-6]|uniref:hypothetical protein n=1 Tax=Streptomyces TaxID=1883 RepID=UPI0009A530C6|nr:MULTISPECIES: hypothetical protein [Streptomyces]RPF41828.1 hypothetical protein EDD96_5653 [Streptomyces sp. Ag109_G2-6]
MSELSPEASPVERGLYWGTVVLGQQGIQMDSAKLRDSVESAAAVVRDREELRADRATELFITNVTIAAGARVAFGEEPLTSEEISQSVDFFDWFLNSYWHV